MKMLRNVTLSLIGTVLTVFLLAFQAHSQEADDYEISQAELDQILAPIALYPDTVLSHILIAATYPLEVIQAERWARENSELEGEDALQAVERKDWDPSVKALVPFPQILERMSDNLDWMQKLGDAFLQNEELVLASIQELRRRAWEEGSLEDLEHLEVSHEDDDIVIEPALREVVYVPYYDTRVVYGSWWWVDYPPIYWTHHRYNFHSGLHFYWGPRIHVGHSFYFSGVHWHNHHIVVVDRRYARRHHFHTGRQVVRHRDSHRWIHNTRHRRGVEYRHPRLRENHRTAGVRHPRDHDARDLSQRLRHPTSRQGIRENHTRDSDARISRHQREENHANIQRGPSRGEHSNTADLRNSRLQNHPRLNNDDIRNIQDYRDRNDRITHNSRQDAVKQPLPQTNRNTTIRSTSPRENNARTTTHNSNTRSTTRSTTRSMRSDAPSSSRTRASNANRHSRSESRGGGRSSARSNSRHERR